MKSNRIVSGSMFKAFKYTWKSDAISGFLVFLIALPLCLGISKASGFPPIAGIYTAIIGGILVSFIGGTYLTIKGPAAGLIVIALGAVEELGHGDMMLGYQLTLAVVVISGIIQILMGLAKSGFIIDLMPSAAIHGMLASIGIIIASKQIHVAMGVKPSGKEPIELIMEIPHSITHMNPELAIIGILSILILFTLPKLKNRYAKMIPGPLLVLFIAVPLGLYFDLNHEHDYKFISTFHLDPSEILVRLPESILSGITYPDFSQIFSMTSIKYIIMFSLVGSIESLLSAKAVDTLDVYKRKSNMDKDLLAVGIGNTIAGFIGGLPMIAEVVRSSANINNGAKTSWSNFFHGLFLLIAIVFAAGLIELIPNAALAAMLIFTGYRLASPDEFKKTFKIGPDQLVIFIATMIVTLFTDLLLGIAFGILVKILQHVFFGAEFKSLFKFNAEVKKTANNVIINVKDSAVFSNYLGFKKIIKEIKDPSNVEINFQNATMVDHTFMEHLHEIEEDLAQNGHNVYVHGMEELTPYSDHPYSARKYLHQAIFAPTKLTLNDRQKDLLKLAQFHGFSFDHKRTTSILKFRFAPFEIAKKAEYGENMILAATQHCNFFITDIHVEEGALMTKRNYSMSIILVTDIHKEIPEFILEKTGALDMIKEIGGLHDIDFDQYPNFSDEYFLGGHKENEEAIRQFFNPELLRFFELNKGYTVECKNNVLLIFKHINLMSITETNQSIDFVKGLIETIHIHENIQKLSDKTIKEKIIHPDKSRIKK